MSNRVTISLDTKEGRQRACARIMASPGGHVAAIGEETRSQEQNRLMWPLIADMRAQIPGFETYSADDTKLRFLHGLGQELRFLPELEGAGMFPVGQRSSTLSKSQFSALIELMFAYGAKHEVQWSRKSEETRAEVARDSRLMREAPGREAGPARKGESGGAKQSPKGVSHDR